MKTSDGLLLDTCALIWLSQDAPVADGVEDAIRKARSNGGLHVSAITAWEMGMLVSKQRMPATKHPLQWFDDFTANANVNVCDASPVILVASSYLPQPVHNDPTDRIIIATARENGLTIITRDRAILSYGAAGHVKTLAC
jgi:PIN domain nuclease of toxin-antitoxin system